MECAIVGLGNHGIEYEGTRHNVGFMVVDALCEILDTDLDAGKGDYLLAVSEYEGREVALVKPLTYVNNSGYAVEQLMHRNTLGLKDLLIVCDDFNLPLGRIRLRPKGSDGGHNGLYSIIYQLGSEEFPRLRCGIGRPESTVSKFDAYSFVLSMFDRDEIPSVRRMIRAAYQAALCFASEGITAAMDQWNSFGNNEKNEASVTAD